MAFSIAWKKELEASRILGIFPVPGRSQFILGRALMKGLADKGHHVVIATPFSDGTAPNGSNYRQIVLRKIYDEHLINPSNLLVDLNGSPMKETLFLKELGKYLATETFEDPAIKELMNSNTKFDAVIIEEFHCTSLKMLSWHFKAPLIIFSSFYPNTWSNYIVANPSPPSYISELLLDYTSMNFIQRAHNSIHRIFQEFYNHFLLLPAQTEIAKKYFPGAPDLSDVHYNTSLLLTNSHVSVSGAVPTVPNLKEIGGFHVQVEKSLPADLEEIMDRSKGVVLFSLGSNLRSSQLPAETRKMFLRAFSKIEHTVLWKFEENLTGLPENVVIRKWLPQQEILAHKNTKLFITHGGLLSTTETIHHGIPILAIPVYADQKLNAATALASGYGLTIHYDNLTESYFDQCLFDLLHNRRYTTRAKEISKIYHDRPMKPLDKAIFWIEYVIRYKGAHHLQVDGLYLPWYQYLLLDVIGFLMLAILVFYVVFNKTLQVICRNCKNKIEPKKDKNQ